MISSETTRAVIVGGSSGIGLATARLLSADGVQVSILGGRHVEDALAQLPGNAEGHVVDVRDEDAVRATFARIGSFDHLAYTAGETLTFGPVTELSLPAARTALEIRIWGAYTAVKHAVPHLRPGGSITLTSGTAGQRPAPTWSLVSAFCGAIEAATRALAVELAPIRVNAVAPGVVRTDLWRDMDEADRDGFYASFAASLPVGRVAEPEDIAEAYVYLMRSGYTTGTVLPINGGALLV